jgi:type IV pilus assembly protein PilO
MADLKEVVSQFQGLSLENVGSWPPAPKFAAWGGAIVLCLIVGWFALWSGQLDELQRLTAEEENLRGQFKLKMQQAVNLEELQRQKEQVNQYVLTLEKQLPSRSEMEELLSELSRAWTGRGVQFELLKPGNRITRDYYEEQPIALRVAGRYHDLGAFTSDLANLPRIVTLQNLALQTGKDGGVSMDATIRSFRYLSDEEVQAQRKPATTQGKK